MLGDRHEAEDAAQETFLLAYRAWQQFRGESSRKAWVYRIAANVCARILERRRHAIGRRSADEAQPRTGDAPPEGPLEARELERGVRLALQDLSPAHRMVLILFCIEDLAHAEIAELLGCPQGTVWSRLHHARKAFAARLRQHGFSAPVDYERARHE